MLIPLEGSIPEPAFGTTFEGYRVRCLQSNLAYLNAESCTEQMHGSFRANLESGELVNLGQHAWGSFVDGVNAGHTRVMLVNRYAEGDPTPCTSGRPVRPPARCSLAYLWSGGIISRRRITSREMLLANNIGEVKWRDSRVF